MPGPGMRVPVGDAARREVDAVAAHEPLGRRRARPRADEQRARRRRRRRAPTRARGRRRASWTTRLRPASALGAVGMLGEREPQWKYWPPSMTIVWPVMNVGARAAQEDDRADDVLGHLVALDRARADRDVAQLLDHLGVLARRRRSS